MRIATVRAHVPPSQYHDGSSAMAGASHTHEPRRSDVVPEGVGVGCHYDRPWDNTSTSGGDRREEAYRGDVVEGVGVDSDDDVPDDDVPMGCWGL